MERTDPTGLATWEKKTTVCYNKVKHDPINSGNRWIDKLGEAAISVAMNSCGYPAVGIRETVITPCPPGYFELPGVIKSIHYKKNTVTTETWLIWYRTGNPSRIKVKAYPDPAAAATGLRDIIAKGGNPVRGPQRIGIKIEQHCVETLSKGPCCKNPL